MSETQGPNLFTKIFNRDPLAKPAKSPPAPVARPRNDFPSLQVLKAGHAARILFFYTDEDSAYIENCFVTLFENGIVHIKADYEETTTHLQHCEIIWKMEVPAGKNSDGPAGRIIPFNEKS